MKYYKPIVKNIRRFCLLLFTIFMFSCTGVTDIDIEMDLPITVQYNKEFVITIKLINTSDKPQDLVSIDIGEKYLKGIAIIKTEPLFKESIHIPIENSESYVFNKKINPKDSITIRIYCKAISHGDFGDDIDFCINSDFNFITKIARTVVK